MYVPFAFDLIRVEQEQLRRRTEGALRRSVPTAAATDESTGRNWTLRRSHRRAAATC